MSPGSDDNTSNLSPISTLPSNLASQSRHTQSAFSAPCLLLIHCCCFSQPNPTPPRNAPHRNNRPKQRHNTDVIIDSIDKQLENKISSTKHFLLSLAPLVDKVPEDLHGYCMMHLVDVITQYQRGMIPITLMQVQMPMMQVQTHYV